VVNFFHLAGIQLAPGSIVEPGNWGRIILATGPQHPEYQREIALENARLAKYPHKPSRLKAAFTSVDAGEAKAFRARIPGFTHHILYWVELAEPHAPSHLTDTRLGKPQGTQAYDWADLYWRDYDAAAIEIPGIGSWVGATNGIACREIVTLSPLIIRERL
jgi:hypothetical protein